METVRKDFVVRRVISYELAAFTLIIALIWLDELADIPHLLLGAEKTPVNWRESLFETMLITPIGAIIIYYTNILIRRMKYLEGFLPICSSCKKIKDEKDNWQPIESYIHDRTEAQFSHGLCPCCAKKLYPEIFSDSDDPKQYVPTNR
ncbi:MAG: hypothetical protein KJ630_00985 [Proteobacteria bacterium]|nr:hypothetical protein [Pseudomonadota bacterium]